MTGYDIYEKAMLYIGMGDNNGEISDGNAVLPIALEAVNQIGYDLCEMKPKSSLFETVEAPENVLSAMPYGVGMIIAMSMGLTQQNALMSELYSAKRTTIKSGSSKIKDRLPVSGVGV